MLTETNVLRSLMVFALWMATLPLLGQDTVNIIPFERYWTQARLIPKVGVGIQQTAFAELGIALHKVYVHPLNLASAGPYLTVDGMLKDDVFIMGPKLGYEVTAGLLGLALDATYYTDFEHEAFLFTPRAGLSIMGFVNLFYGRNVALSDFQFKAIDKNRFSLVFNLNRDYFDLRSAPKKIPGQKN